MNLLSITAVTPMSYRSFHDVLLLTTTLFIPRPGACYCLHSPTFISCNDHFQALCYCWCCNGLSCSFAIVLLQDRYRQV